MPKPEGTVREQPRVEPKPSFPGPVPNDSPDVRKVVRSDGQRGQWPDLLWARPLRVETALSNERFAREQIHESVRRRVNRIADDREVVEPPRARKAQARVPRLLRDVTPRRREEERPDRIVCREHPLDRPAAVVGLPARHEEVDSAASRAMEQHAPACDGGGDLPYDVSGHVARARCLDVTRRSRTRAARRSGSSSDRSTRCGAPR